MGSPPLDALDTVRAQLEASGRFRVFSRLGAGGTGLVYRVHDRERGEDVALKTLRLQDAAATYGIKREFRSLADVTHPNLVNLHELLCVNDCWCITMELVEGSDFLSHVTGERSGQSALLGTTTRVTPALLAAGPGMPPSEPPSDDRFLTADLPRLSDALWQLASAVDALHRAGKLHLDLKPPNVLVQPDGRVVVLDFGLVREIEGKHALENGQFVGTPAYMAPEQASSTPPTEAADWYAVGCMLYEALTGITPFIGTKTSLLREKQLRDAPPAHTVAREVPRPWSDLCQLLLERDPHARGGFAAVASLLGASGARHDTRVSVRPFGTRFVGRSDALARLDEWFQHTLSGAPRAIFLHGPSGIGKSALARTWLRSLRTRKPEVLLFEGRCLEREAVPYKALDSVVDELSRYLQSLPEARVEALAPEHLSALVRVFPVLSRVRAFGHALHRASHPEEQTERELAFLALKDLLGRLAQAHGLVVFVDDLQWGDRDSALLVRELLSPPAAPAVLWLGTYRTEEEASSPFLRALLSASSDATFRAAIVRQALPPLAEADLVELTRGILQQQGKADALAPVIARECEGNPFFAEELVQGLARDVPLPRAQEASPSLEAVLLARVRALPPPEREMLERVCVIGRPVERALVLATPDVGPSTIDSLRAQRLLRTRGTREIDLVEPYHDRIREIVGASVERATRMRIHLALARQLEARQRGDAELLMLHYAEAGDHAEAARHAEHAALLADHALAFDHAATLWRHAIEYGAQHHGPEQEGALYAALARALEQAGRAGEAAEAYAAAAARTSAPAAFALLRKAAEQRLVSGHYAEGMALFREALPHFGVRLAKSSRWALLSLAGLRARLTLRGLAFEERGEVSIDRKLLSRIDTSYAVANSLGMLDSLIAADVQTRGVLWALEAGEPFRVLRALTYEAAFRCGNLSGQTDTGKILESAEALASRINSPAARGLVAFSRGFYAHHGLGKLRASKQPYEEGERLLLGAPGMNGEIVMLRCSFLTALDWLGDIPTLKDRVPTHLEDAERRGDLFLKTGIVSAALYWLAQDAPEQLAAHIQQCRALWPEDVFLMPYYWLLVAESQRDVYAGDGRACLARVDAAWRDLQRSFYLTIPTVRIEILYPRARAAILCARKGQDTSRMLGQAARDVRTLEATQREYARALSASLRANLLALEGAPEAGIIWALEDAIAQSEEAGLVLQAEAARLCLGQVLGGDAGAFLQRSAVSALLERQVKEPRRLAAALMPGFLA